MSGEMLLGVVLGVMGVLIIVLVIVNLSVENANLREKSLEYMEKYKQADQYLLRHEAFCVSIYNVIVNPLADEIVIKLKEEKVPITQGKALAKWIALFRLLNDSHHGDLRIFRLLDILFLINEAQVEQKFVIEPKVDGSGLRGGETNNIYPDSILGLVSWKGLASSIVEEVPITWLREPRAD